MSTWQRRSGIQLAYPYDPKRLSKWSKPYIVQPKLNGNRCRAIISQHQVVLLSSEENEILSVPHINEALFNLAHKHQINHLELDGELYVHGMRKQEIDSITGRTKNIHPDFEKMELHLFDIVDLLTVQDCRLSLLYCDVQSRFFNTPCIKFTEGHQVSEQWEIEGLFEHYVGEGYEGIILRNPSARYQRKRTTDMMKWKARATDSYLIVSYHEEKDQFGTPKGRLGALTCEKDSQQFNVGSGTLLTHEMRQHLWDIRETLPGKYALIKYPELTLRGVPGHPTIVGITDTEVQDNE